MYDQVAALCSTRFHGQLTYALPGNHFDKNGFINEFVQSVLYMKNIFQYFYHNILSNVYRF